MRVVSFRDDVLFGIANELDLDIGTPDFNHSHSRKFVNSVNKWIRKAWRFWNWPELTLTEERALRPIRDDAFSYAAGTELYDIATGSYYRAKVAIAPGDPVSNATKWEIVTSPDPFLAYDQVGKQFMGEVLAVHATDPRLVTRAGTGWQFYPEERGIRLPIGARPTVWVTFRTRPSQFTADDYDAERAYKARDLVYEMDKGECFRAAIDLAPGVAITNSGWIWQPMPFVLAEYVRMQSAADASADVAQKSDFRGQALDAIAGEIDQLRAQGAPAGRYRLFPRRDSRSASGLGGSLEIPYSLVQVT